ncbi:TRAP transporter large permease subunit [Rhodobacter sp. NTK016B]|uniref:TRAP transporter large permease subunit n=1 Tax=Rhodobacter sp. NTK016B TaxID=2759676 RepID=UPI001A90BF21|nr:TRAP transporter large permease subunit [Rhodobacter sp. NTK016B]MBN8294375.1 TRAP transporter large permease subunit [Rhodobacter sp. NTK016B]
METEQPLLRPMTRRIVFFMALVFVITGMINSTPAIPGWDAFWRGLTGWDWLEVRRFPYEYYYPIAFAWMMIIVALWHSCWREWQAQGAVKRRLGLALDIALVTAAIAISVTYLIENEAVCLIDVITGERAALIERALAAEREVALALGLPAPSSIDDPRCLATTGPWITLIVGLAVVVFLAYNAQVWGFSLVMVSIALAAYAIATVLIWYWFGSDGMNRYLITELGGEPRSLADGRYRLQDLLTNQGSGLLGQFLHIMLNTVFPYIVLGSLLSVSAGGRALIKLAVVSTRKLRGGAAHAAIVASALFGTTTGTPVVNVLGTGTITIPMMIRGGFSKSYAGGIEAAASSGGQVMPPIMGIAAFVLAAMTGVPYRDVAIAAAIPAVAYFLCMFLSVMFQARRQQIPAVGEVPPELRLTRRDLLLLTQIFVPLALIIVLLLVPKDAIGCDPISLALGAVAVEGPNGTCRAENLPWIMQLIQNTLGDAGSTGWWAAIVLMIMLFIDPLFRREPRRLVDALAHAGITSAGLYLMFLAVSVIDISLNLTALPSFVALDILGWLRALDLGNGAPMLFQFAALGVTMVLAILLGMGMPAVPAYVNAALLMGPLLVGLGMAHFTAHMFIFYFACVSAITPPVAVASYAASTIAKSDPVGTSFSAVRSGIVMFVIPFIFAFNPEILLVQAAVLNPDGASGGERFLPGYDGEFHLIALMWLLARLGLSLYLLASALARFDQRRLPPIEVAGRLLLALLVLSGNPALQWPAVACGAALLVWHQLRGGRPPAPFAT